MRDELEMAFAAEAVEIAAPFQAPSLQVRMIAEAFGTFWLVLGGCGTAVLSTASSGTAGIVGVALAFGLTVMTMAYALGHVSGGHLNPAVSLGLWAAGRFPARKSRLMEPPSCLAHLPAPISSSPLQAVRPIMTRPSKALRRNGYGVASPGGYSLVSALLTETILTFGFVIVITGATDARAPKALAPLCIGLALTLIHLISIPVTNTSVNPARSTGPALLLGGLAFQQLWLFWLAPLAGGAAAGAAYKAVFAARRSVERQRPERGMPWKAS